MKSLPLKLLSEGNIGSVPIVHSWTVRGRRKLYTNHTDVQQQNRYAKVKAIEDGTIDEFDHKNPPLNDKVLEVIKPIYESLSADSLLERCLGSETQNNNESLNSLIWTFAPKHIHAGPKTIEIATFFAVSIFNEGFIPILKILDVMGITIGPEANAFAARRDEARIERSELRTSEASKEGRTARLHQRTSENEHFEVEEGFLYEAGIAD
ncbi:uncharacterized protein CDAR_415131 [Caerostris darwini]|uniref:Uncharacterized protein n=1 Tax=Caerostris darwini TaxID=1538125 RepID=A0AAV4TGC1_9ARAC|nr:uncharacterized protein CDAR_415131 [Caerostris darwini]